MVMEMGLGSVMGLEKDLGSVMVRGLEKDLAKVMDWVTG